MEQWRTIEGYEGLYQISNYGRIKSLGNDKTRKEKLLKPQKIRNGYLRVGLRKDVKSKYFLVHRLVATTFLENPNNYLEVNHKDENPLNNCVSNLEWCDRKYNCNYGTRNEKVSGKLSKQVFQYDKNFNLIKIWDSTQECGRNGFKQGNIASCCRGDRKSHKGFIWSYERRVINS